MPLSTEPLLAPPPPLDIARDALFLDFDGTLVEIAPRPDAITLPPGLAARLAALEGAVGGAFALVSGRNLAELVRYLDGFGGLIIGGHGAEARGLSGADAPPPESLAALQSRMSAFARAERLLYEPKAHGAALHYRSRPEFGPEVEAFIQSLLQQFSAFSVQPAKMAYELRPASASKDRALARLWDLPRFAGRRPVFLGDDTTDEPAIAWAAAQGGYGVKVGPGETAARYRLADPAAVLSWLEGGA